MASTALAAEIGCRIRDLRLARGWSQSDLARRTGLASRSVVSFYELGDRYPSYETLLRLADVFDVTTDYLLRGNDGRESDIVESIKRKDGDMYIRVRSGVLSDVQVEAVMALIRKLHDDKM